MARYCISLSKRGRIKAAKTMERYKLRVNNWSMAYWLSYPKWIEAIAIVREGGIPIAGGVRLKRGDEDSPNIGVYVQHKHRRKGIGSRIIKILCKCDKTIYAAKGVEGSDKFYRHLAKETDNLQYILY